MTKRNFKPRQIACWAAIALLCGGCLPAGAAAAQEIKPAAAKPTFLEPEPAPPPPVEKVRRPTPSEPKPAKSVPVPVARPEGNSTMKVYALKYADASTIVLAIGQMPLFSTQRPVSVALDERTNSVLVLALPETHQHVSKIIAQLDVPRDANLTAQLRVYPLNHADPASVAEVLSNILTLENTRIAVDERTRSILVASSEETLERVGALLSNLDVPAAADARADVPGTMFRVRVVWLASGLSGDEAAKPADDLKDVIDELSKVGVEGLRQVGQVLVNTTPDGRFEVHSSPALGESSAKWEISGEFESRQGTPVLQIQLSATESFMLGGMGVGEARRPSVEEQTLVNLDTAIAAPPGHFVVLGTAPVDKMTSAFVLQVTPNKKD